MYLQTQVRGRKVVGLRDNGLRRSGNRRKPRHQGIQFRPDTVALALDGTTDTGSVGIFFVQPDMCFDKTGFRQTIAVQKNNDVRTCFPAPLLSRIAGLGRA